jgi:hypothetical protein
VIACQVRFDPATIERVQADLDDVSRAMLGA